MRRRMLIAISIGLVLNFTVAFACTVWSALRASDEWTVTDRRADEAPVPIPAAWLVPEEPGPVHALWTRYDGLGITKWSLTVNASSERRRGKAEHGIGYLRAGFPFGTLGGAVLVDTFPAWTATTRGAVETPAFLGGGRRHVATDPSPWVGDYIPLHPRLVGTVANTLFYSLIIVGPVELRRGIVRASRAKRTLCPGCGYDRRGLAADAKCPECGTVPTK